LARPTKVIDWTHFDKLAALQCTLKEIAAFFNCSEDTIENAVKREKKMRFSEYYDQKRRAGWVSLRRKQYEKAMEGNVVMLIWLGKQYLGQTEKIQPVDTENGNMKFIPIAYMPKNVRVLADGSILPEEKKKKNE
jgi:hypothetical protein